MNNPKGAGEGWVPQEEYDLIQARVPILCVDLLPLDPSTGAIGLIHRETYEGDRGWCLVGGAVRRGESLLEAISRHLESTLGSNLEHDLTSATPLAIAEYFPEPEPGKLHDPRKHAVALSYAATVTGEPNARGEALEFRWFDRGELGGVDFGFGQGEVVGRILDRLDRRADGWPRARPTSSS